jgi:prepilin-type N-terminal cleavage/methylation domain-containing protein
MIRARTIPSRPDAGFTLVETLVAIAILMIAIVGPFYMLQQAITSANTARDQLIASSLAQEGVEYVYYVRNNNYLAGRSWLSGISGCTSSAGCTVDAVRNEIAACASSGCPPLNVYSSGGSTRYVHSLGSSSRFTRTLRLTQVSANQLQVSVTVQWTTNRAPYTVQVVEDLYNWL